MKTEDDLHEDDGVDEENGLLWRLLSLTPYMTVMFVLLYAISFVMIAQYYALPQPTKTVDWLDAPTNIAIRGNNSRITVMWDPSPTSENVLKSKFDACDGSITNGAVVYRIYQLRGKKETALVWMETKSSPTLRLGVHVYNVRGSKKGESVKFKLISQYGRCASEEEHTWIQIGRYNFSQPSSSRAPLPPSSMSVTDMSTVMGEEWLLVEWEQPIGEDVQGLGTAQAYELFFYEKKNNARVHLKRTQHFMRQYVHNVSGMGHGKYCYSVKAESWGDVGLSAPRTKCLLVREWLWEEQERKAKLAATEQ